MVYFILSFVTVAVYSGVLSHAFINFDDPLYVTQNPYVLNGLHLTSLAWALKGCQSTFFSNIPRHHVLCVVVPWVFPLFSG